MRLQVRRDIIFLLLVGMVVIVVLFSSNWLVSRVRGNTQPFLLPTMTSPNNVIQSENALPGTSNWKIPDDKAASIQIQAYAGATSVQPGQILTFYVSTEVDGTPYSIGIYRLGWYGGAGGRLEYIQANQVGHAQGYYDRTKRQIVNCNSCSVDPQTGLVEANWQPSYKLKIPPDWVTGVYLAKFVDGKGFQTYATFDVKGNPHSTYVVVTSDTTYAAYNNWGGYSLYEAENGSGTNDSETTTLMKGEKVSFDRPYVQGHGSGHVLVFDAETIHWLEGQGYDLSYISSVDLHENPRQLLQHRASLSLGHDEYWTKEMRDGVEQARDHGVGLAFLGADASYWQMRFEADSAGNPDRTIVCYKVETRNNDLARDPLFGKDNARVTSQWRDPVLGRPENALIGIMYSNLTHKQNGFSWQVSPQAKSPLIDGTGLQPGQHYGCGLVGYEWDHIFSNGATPPGLQVIGESRTFDNNNIPDFSNTTYYIAPSGAMIFASGSIYWTSSLDSYRFSNDALCAGQEPVVPGIQKLMAKVMNELIIHHSHT